MKISFDTAKFYYGFPVFVLGYKDEVFGYNITTSTSSYSLGDMLVIGLFKENNAAKQIAKHKAFTVNIPIIDQMAMAEQAGFVSHRDKLDLTGLAYHPAKTIDAPVLTDYPVSMECQVVEMVEFGAYVHFVARITYREAEENLLVDGVFQSQAFHPMLYMGDEKARIYHQMTGETKPLGHFLKENRRRKRREEHR